MVPETLHDACFRSSNGSSTKQHRRLVLWRTARHDADNHLKSIHDDLNTKISKPHNTNTHDIHQNHAASNARCFVTVCVENTCFRPQNGTTALQHHQEQAHCERNAAAECCSTYRCNNSHTQQQLQTCRSRIQARHETHHSKSRKEATSSFRTESSG